MSKFTLVGLIVTLSSAMAPAAALANCGRGRGIGRGFTERCASVPEITAMEGTAAIVALAAIVLLTWERSLRTR